MLLLHEYSNVTIICQYVFHIDRHAPQQQNSSLLFGDLGRERLESAPLEAQEGGNKFVVQSSDCLHWSPRAAGGTLFLGRKRVPPDPLPEKPKAFDSSLASLPRPVRQTEKRSVIGIM